MGEPTTGTVEATPPARRSAASALAVFFERRSLVMLALGFAAGLPNLLIFDTLSAWLRDAGLSLETIGFFSLATLSYSLKFTWAPLLDRASVPVLTRWLGHRRSWMLVAQALIVVGLWLIAGCDPRSQLALMAGLAVLVGFSSASQDVVIDAWRIEVAGDDRQGALAAAYQWGYRIAMLVAGIVPLAMAERLGWSLSYTTMASLMAVGVAAVLAAPRERAHVLRPIATEGAVRAPVLEAAEWLVRLAILAAAALLIGSGLAGKPVLVERLMDAAGAPGAAAGLAEAWTAKGSGVFVQAGAVAVGFALLVVAALPVPGVRTRPSLYLAHAFGAPLRDFATRYGSRAAPVLALICVYRLADNVLNVMSPFYLDLGFTLTEVGSVRKAFGVWMSMLGVFAAGFAIARLGLVRALFVGAFAGPVSNLVFIALATQGADIRVLAAAIAVDNVASGYAGTCLIAYMSSLTSAGFTATQYALFSSLYALPGKILASQSGRLVEGAARSADAGGLFAPLRAPFRSAPPEAFASAPAASGVSPASLGAGYVAFFLYSTVIGAIGIALAWWLLRATRRDELRRDEATGAAAPP